MKLITKVTRTEKDEILTLFERMNSLNTLITTLATADIEAKEQNWLYEKVIKDLEETRLNYSQWWANTCEKYNIENNVSNLNMNFYESAIYEVESI